MAATKLTTIIDNHMNKIQPNDKDKFTLKAVEKSKKFLGKTKNVFIVNADKGNITVTVEKDDNDTKLGSIIGDMMT